MVQVSCYEVRVSGSDQVKGKRGWETGRSRIVKKASFSSNTVKNCVWEGIVQESIRGGNRVCMENGSWTPRMGVL
jgi:hypothetical protein